ncbi:hypothetical protein [Streptomyces hesseae]|uniref:Acyl carrier protein n=1 Tax=Streptomyces hesseae TaxID=3075519 RepID=A0ABU2SU44_9ACTN|nr:hypothetical protein [Streptomyces sp. DSM 40473]MDT0452380.1 hypothetical protein [Streptomyces sp. DSM 40473]
MVPRRGLCGGPDPVALIEIDLYGDLMIAASMADEERLSVDRIDEILRVVRPVRRAESGNPVGSANPAGPAKASGAQ